MEIPRKIESQIQRQIGKQKVIVLYGSRRTSKSTIKKRNISKQRKKQNFCFEKKLF